MRLVQKQPHLAYLAESLWVPKTLINVDAVKNALTFELSGRLEEQLLCLWEEAEHHLLVPRGFWGPNQKIPFELVDCRPTQFKSVHFNSNITLDFKNPTETVQRDAVQAMLAAQGGILQLACGRGKSVVALEVISRLKVPALIVVDNTQLLEQWAKEITKFLAIAPEDIGLIGNGRMDWQRPIVIGTYQTLSGKAEVIPEELRRWFGVTIWDEVHHVAAPMFSKSIKLFYGRRYGLTATPDRIDGLNVVYEMHLGPVLYKNLTQNLKPSVYFLWTGVTADVTDPAIHLEICSKTGELHLGKLSSYFSRHEQRIAMILTELREAKLNDRKILVLSSSVDELINLYAAWVGFTKYTDACPITEERIGKPLDKKQLKKLWASYYAAKDRLAKSTPQDIEKHKLAVARFNEAIEENKRAVEYAKEARRLQRLYIKDLLQVESDAGLLTYKVPIEQRKKMLATKDIIFSIMKYGKEGLDKPMLDTIFLCDPISQRNVLQQVMGRALREMAGKNSPIFVVIEDDVKLVIGMCNRLRKHLREWPVEEGGPYTYSFVNNPKHNKLQLPRWL